MRVLIVALLFAIACLAGLLTSEVLWRLPGVRAALDDLAARYSADSLRRLSNAEAVEQSAIKREMNLLVYQFPNEQAFAKAVLAEGSSDAALRRQVSEHLRARQWIEKEIANSLGVT